MTYLTEILNTYHNRKTFQCGNSILDNYLKIQANQDIKRKLTACFILNDTANNNVKAFYTLSNYSIPNKSIPETYRKKFPKSYSSIPTTLLGRLAVDNRFKGQNLGRLLLIDALKRSYNISKSIGSFAVIVDPIDNDAINFYTKFGFKMLPNNGRMFLPMKTIEMLFK